MSMFKELYQLALGATLTMTVSADEKQGKLTINVIPKPKTEAGEAALNTPLTLTASPEEFDADFIAALTGFRVAHTSLTQQALVTQEVDYACGCRSIAHEYHDGSVSRRVVRHDGAVLVDESDSAE